MKTTKKIRLQRKSLVHGEFGKSHTNTLEAIWELLKNAFIRALVPAIDNKINISTVTKPDEQQRSFVGRLLHGKKDKKDKKRDDK